ncbi:MAG TPA: hypothetical protein VGH19_06800 [Verrucomicrobiae bacterium]
MCTTIQAENPTKKAAEDQAVLQEFFKGVRECQTESKAAALAGIEALNRLIEACRHQSGQSYKIRSMLYSLFNGQPADMSDIQTLDWALRKDLTAVALGMGCPGFPDYLIKEMFKAAKLGKWFLEAQHTK